MDADIDELKDLVKKNMELTQDTHRMVRAMRRSSLWGSFFSILWWVVALALTGAAYYYAQPYIQQIEHLYTQVQQLSGH